MFFGKPHIENPVIYHSSRMAQRELRLMGKVVQPLQSVSKYYNSAAHSYEWLWFEMVLSKHTSLCDNYIIGSM
jgi:hypothetical protein